MIPNTEQSYKSLSAATVKARKSSDFGDPLTFPKEFFSDLFPSNCVKRKV